MRRSPATDQSARPRIGSYDGAGADPCRDGPVEAELSMNAKAELEEYFREAESWDADRVERGLRNLKLAGWVAAAGWTCAIACAAALVVLMP